MKLEYQGVQEESSFILTDFNCSPAQNLLQDKGYYKVIWNRDENFSINVDGYFVELLKDQVIFCTPVNILRIPQDSGIVSIVFNREFYCLRDHDHEVSCHGLLFFGSSLPPVITLKKGELRSFELMFELFKEEFANRDHIQGEMLRVLLKRLLIKSTRLIKEDTLAPKMTVTQIDLLRKYHVLVENNFRDKHKVSDYAEMLNKSPKTLSNVFKKNGDESPLKIINNRIILEAKRLLLFSDKNIDEIGYELGYHEASHFSKFFKSHTGLPPAQFKEKQLSYKNEQST